MTKVLIADDHEIVRKGLQIQFRTIPNIDVVGEVSDGEKVLDFLRLNEVDIILLDIDMPKVNGITIIRSIKIEFPLVKVLIYSMHPEEVYAISSLKAGASGYVSKGASLDILSEAIRKISNGGIYISNELAQRLAFDESTNRPGRLFKKLSIREIEVLKLLSTGKRNKDIAKELDINEKTVSTYKARLLRKLGVNNMIELLQHAKNLELLY